MTSSIAPVASRPTLYRGLQQAIYDEMDRQAASGKRDPEVLDRLHELLQVGAPFQVDQRVQSVAGDNQGKSGVITSVGVGANYVLYDDGASELLPHDSTQRDWIALARF